MLLRQPLPSSSSPPPASRVAALPGPGLLKPFSFTFEGAHPRVRRVAPRVAPMLERLLGLDALNRMYARITSPGDDRSFFERALADLGVGYRVAADDLRRIPKSGPLVVVANHPFGALDGMVLSALLAGVRGDVKVMANYLLSRMPEMREHTFFVDPFGGEGKAAANAGAMRAALRWVRAGNVLAVFPAGEVAHLDLHTRRVEESPWGAAIARLALLAGAPVLPIYFAGQNSRVFQVAGLIHPKLRTALLPREVFRQRGAQLDVRVGSLVPHRRLVEANAGGDAQQVADLLRRRTLLLRHRPAGGTTTVNGQTVDRVAEPVCAADPPDVLAAEVAALPPDRRLADAGALSVYRAGAAEIPRVLREIGRLREVTYRATGEGTGKSIDLDRFDDHYIHLFVWHAEHREVVGAYRLGASDALMAAQGVEGLYTSTLFHYSPALIERLGPALELGRSFVRVEHQRSFAPLLLLWKGIGRCVVDKPQYRTLFGPVSISNDYQTVSKQLMVGFLEAQHGAAELAALTRARNPYRPAGRSAVDDESLGRILPTGAADVDDLVADVEPDGKGIPVLLRQYLKLGARFLAFNVDREFSDALDGLMIVDLAQTERKMLDRYLTPAGAARFLEWQGVSTAARGPERNHAE